MKRRCTLIVLAGSAFVLAGCGRGPETPTNNNAAEPASSSANTQRITLHVKNMVERQGIT
jgi:hypothetical protein